MDLSIVIVNWNSKDFLGPCLRSVDRWTRGIRYETIVIDSGSFDGCGAMLAAEFPAVRFIQCEANRGFAGANNEAFALATGRCILFLNPDTELESPAANRMLEHVDRSPDAGAVGCRLLNGDGSLQTCCVQSFPTILGQLLASDALRRRFPRWKLWGMPPLPGQGDAPARVDVVSGACLMVRRTAFEQVGLFSEDYFMYAEDLDLCFKLRRAGLVNYHLPGPTVRHFGGGSSEKAPSDFSVVMMRDSIWRFLRKSRGSGYGVAYRLSTVLAALARLAVLSARHPLRPGPSARKWRAIFAWSIGARRATRPA